MARPGYFYSHTPLKEIGASLSRMFASLRRESGDSYVSATASNTIIPVADGGVLDDLDSFVDDLTQIHPSRYFVLVSDNLPGEIRADITARCHLTGTAQHICCEVVRLMCPENRLSAVPELLRANLVPGADARLYLFDPRIGRRFVENVLPLCEDVFFDSSEFENRFDIINLLLDNPIKVIDFEWVRLGFWRNRLRSIFEDREIQNAMDSVESVTLEALVSEDMLRRPRAVSCLMLMAGWLVDRLGLEVFGCSNGAYECHTPRGKKLRIHLQCIPGQGISRLSRLEFGFSSWPDTISLKRGASLEEQVCPARNATTLIPIEDESKLGTIRRFFQTGTDLTLYQNALRNAVDMRLLGE